MAGPIQVCLVEDDELIRTSFARMLDQAPGFRCAATYADGPSALAGLPVACPNVVLMDINLPGMSGIECVQELKAKMPALPVLMLTVYDDNDRVFQSLAAGATGYLLKRTSQDNILGAIREVITGGAPMSPQIARRVVQYFHNARRPSRREQTVEMQSLTAREQEILAHLAKGHTYKETAARLDISMDTVRTHIRNIYEKLHVHSRSEAIVKFLGH